MIEEEMGMSAREFMKLGILCAATAVFMAFMAENFGIAAVVLGFGGGALFGKGYGIWEREWEKRDDA